MADAFIFSQAQFQRILSNYLGLEGVISIPHTHHCGGGAVRVLTEGTVNHLQMSPFLGRNSAPQPHDAVRDVLSLLWCKTVSPMPQLWRHGLRQQTEEPTMLTWSTSIHPPGRERRRNATMTLSEDC